MKFDIVKEEELVRKDIERLGRKDDIFFNKEFDKLSGVEWNKLDSSFTLKFRFFSCDL